MHQLRVQCSHCAPTSALIAGSPSSTRSLASNAPQAVTHHQAETACSRRQHLALTAAAVAGLPLLQQAAQPMAAQALELQQLLPGAGPAPLEQLLQPGFTAINNPGVSWAVGARGKQLFYPEWMEGTWQVSASFVGVDFPKTQRLISRDVPGVTKASMIMTLSDVGAGMEAPVRYQLRFAASKEEGGIVADRPLNIKQQVDAFLRYPAVQQIDYNPQHNPTRLAVVYKTPRRDTSEISADLRKAEIFINNRGSGYLQDGTWVGWENYRQVNQARQQGSVGDYVAAWGIRRTDDPGVLEIKHRSAAFLQPQDPRYFDAGSAAVAIYDYSVKAVRDGHSPELHHIYTTRSGYQAWMHDTNSLLYCYGCA